MSSEEAPSKPGSSIELVDTKNDASNQEQSVSWRNNIALFILFLINLLNFIDRYTVAGVLTEIQDFYEISDADGGLLQTVFVCFYVVFAPICGYLGDRYNRKWIMTVGICVWSCAVVCSTLIPKEHFVIFLICRGVVGIGEASYSTCAPTIIADIFTGKRRSIGLMLFYFAIPVGSGLGFIVGSNVADWLGHWQWGLRVTPIFGIICLILIVFVLHEPKRGEAEQAQVIPTSYWQDIKYLIFNRTYVYSTLGYTFVVFVAGAMTWWTPTAVEHAWAVTNHKEEASKDVKANISLVFGVITCLGGFFGVTLGSMVAQMWRDGKSCFKSVQNPRADPYVCAIGSFVAAPMLFASIQLFAKNSYLADFFVFLTVLNLCLNWAVVVDISMYVVIPSRRSTASAFQILFCHLFGDAASPYIIGLVSDGLRGSDTSALGHYNSLQRAFYIPNVVLIISGAFFLLSAFYVESDQRKATDEMHSNATCDISATEQSGSLTTSSINSTQ